MRRARCRAASNLHIISISSSGFSLKFDFLSQPEAVLLSPMARRHEDGWMRFPRISSYIHTMLDKNSRKCMCARAKIGVGISHCHAIPLAL